MLLDDAVGDICKPTLPTRVHVSLDDSIAKEEPEKEHSLTIIESVDQLKNELLHHIICDKVVSISFHLFTDYKVVLVYSSFYMHTSYVCREAVHSLKQCYCF